MTEAAIAFPDGPEDLRGVDGLRRLESEPHYHELRFVSLPTAWFAR